ncbi:hypothetical protein L228DRAFT_58911 [Xylona heveae TC161]|uniref:Uncharacterized protein n=1 Tax=Xylona heveae (strain CBS 132557 / TC161) TaxID=1328760 RepID=A0A165IIS0_XYLHT|nr:hypothetical protein L228DRAFT_58911 [Xylona heveae TC161]KZF24950.1 hypothetical protein L228DRAFT_58911 [Xylona heveae TC161]
MVPHKLSFPLFYALAPQPCPSWFVTSHSSRLTTTTNNKQRSLASAPMTKNAHDEERKPSRQILSCATIQYHSRTILLHRQQRPARQAGKETSRRTTTPTYNSINYVKKPRIKYHTEKNKVRKESKGKEKGKIIGTKSQKNTYKNESKSSQRETKGQRKGGGTPEPSPI